MERKPKKKSPWEEEEKCTSLDDLSDQDLSAIISANDEITKREQYGIRKERAKRNSTVLMWSNAQKKWYIKGIEGKVKTEQEVSMDANEILVPISSVRAEKIACHLLDLPLYKASFEAQVRGEVTRQEALGKWLQGWSKQQKMQKSELYKALEQQYWEYVTKEEE